MKVRPTLSVLMLALAALLLSPAAAFAHEERSSSVHLDFHKDNVSGEILLPLDRLEGALRLPLTAAPDQAIPLYGRDITSYVAAHLAVMGDDGEGWQVDLGQLSMGQSNGADYLTLPIVLTPTGGKVTGLTLSYDAILEATVSHEIIVSTSSDGGQRTVIGVLKEATRQIHVDSARGQETGFRDMVTHGYKHVGSGADHLLFLLVLLLPAPLIAVAGRWQRSDNGWHTLLRLFQVVTAFTIGHSLTLMASAFGWVNVASRPVEILIAISVGVGALHALRPLIKGGEPRIAGTFGLVHGLAFAGILSDLGIDGVPAITSLLGFNIGIELAGLTAVALVFPSLYLLSRTPSYSRVRVTGGGLALLASMGWIVERSGLATDPLRPAEGYLVGHPLLVAGAVALLAGVTFACQRPDNVDPASRVAIDPVETGSIATHDRSDADLASVSAGSDSHEVTPQR